MSTALNTLRKILRAEAAGGHADNAVIGGLHKLAPLWEKQASAAGISDNFITAVLHKLQLYASLSLTDRESTVKELLTILETQAASEKADLRDRGMPSAGRGNVPVNPSR